MMLLAYALWPGLAAAGLLGLCVGALSGLPRDRPALVAPALLGGALAVLAGLALTGAVPGEAGLWVESAVLMLAVYVAGCAAGGAGRALIRGA